MPSISACAEANQVFGGRDEAAAGDLIAAVHETGVLDLAVDLLVAPSAERHDLVHVVHERVRRAGRLQHVRRHVVLESLAGRAFDYAAHHRVAVRAVGKGGAGLEQERVVGENRQAVGHPFVMTRALDFAFLVMADARSVAEQLARGDRPLLQGKGRAVFLHWSVQVQLARLH
ncbi:MAG: hypothetical protein LAP87_02160 [Acidobacteriia bacterium]|nr:hypothetical protein [Terriglobia bacterium]